MSPSATFRVVVATHRRARWLGEMLAALAPQIEGRPGRRLVVINDGTHDGDYARALAPYAALVDYRALERSHGPGGARQHGASGATEDYLIFTDDDCVPPPHWLDWAEALAASYPVVDLFCGGTVAHEVPTRGLIARVNARFVPLPAPVRIDGRLVCQPTANMMVRRTAFETAGGFASDFATGSEDWNLTRRLIAAGCSYHIDRRWLTRHRVDQSLRATWRRWWGYGFGIAHQAIREQDHDAKVVRFHREARDGSDRARVAGAGFVTREPLTSVFDRLAFRLIGLMCDVSHAAGWRAGVRRFSRRYGRSVPERPALVYEVAELVRAGGEALSPEPAPRAR